jgi:DNA-3-methyladenine glycosylase
MEKSSTRSSAKSSADKVRGQKLPVSFYRRPTRDVAVALLGKVLVSRSRGSLTSGRIVETEAYVGEIDPAAHCFRGKTPRSSVMFGPPGRAYVYFIYGMYEMLNFVTEPRGTPGAVLIRALEPVAGLSIMRMRRKKAHFDRDLCNGPGKLCQSLGIPMSWNKKRLDSPELYVVDDGFAWEDQAVLSSPRVGIKDGVEHYWRYFAAENSFVSRVRENEKARCILKN